MVGNIGLDRETLKWFQQMKSHFSVELKSEHPVALVKDQVSFSPATATKFAFIAMSKVGCLTPTNANRMVYETALLHIFDEYNVRHNIRMELLGEALVACFIRPESYNRAIRIIEHLGLGTVDALP
jgi:hypothetical protein